MRFTHWMLLLVLSVVLALSVVLGQFVYRIDRTLLSYRYMTEAVPQLLAPLEDPQALGATIASLAGQVRSQLDARMPPQLVQVFDQAAVDAFDRSWFEWTLTRHAYAVLGVVRGSRAELTLPVNISSFQSAFTNRVRSSLPPDIASVVLAEVGNLPGAVDLADAVPEPTKAALVRFGGRYGLLSNLMMYIIPGLLTVACFASRRVGSALLAGGVGYLFGGAAVLVFRVDFGAIAAQRVGSSLRSALPRGLSWVQTGVDGLLRDIASGLFRHATIIAVVGLVATALGIWIIAAGHNDTMDFAQLASSDDEDL